MKLSLGTAQFGGAYGITNTQGRPAQHEIDGILDMFFENGNSFLDTAQEYGDAHKKVSEWRKKNPSVHDNALKVTTKIYVRNKKDIESFYCNVSSICNDLGLGDLYGVLIHNPSSLKDTESCFQLNHQFKLLKQRGLVKKTGVSVYEPQEFLDLYNNLGMTEIDIIQCPVNILDQRFLEPEIQNFCAQHNIEMHARSLFLQGLLLSEEVPEKLKNADVRLTMERYKDFLKSNHLKPLESCCLFAHQHQGKINRWVLGFNSPHELQELLFQASNVNISPDICFDNFKNKYSYIDPRTWSYVKSC